MNAQAHLDQALDFAQDGAYPDAIRLLSELVEALPEEGVVFQALGAVLLQAGQSSDAVLVLERARVLLPDSAPVLEMLAIAQAGSGNPVQALKLFDQLEERVGFNPSSGHFLNRGNALSEAGKIVEAAQSFEQAVALDPMAHQAWGKQKIGILVYRCIQL